jgi:micrococcal nuclease
MRILRFLLRLFPARPKFPSPPRPLPRLPVPAPGQVTILRGRCWVIDGDAIVIDKVRIRLAGIDAPELDHPFGVQSKWALVKLCKGQTITARLRPELSYDRIVAECFLPDGRDLAAELVRAGLALDWPTFSGGKYSHLEVPGARRRLFRAHARQLGRPVIRNDL